VNAVAAEARAWLRFLFSPHGWIGRANYLRGAAIVVMLNILFIGLISYVFRGPGPGPYGVFATLPISLALTTKRLHALGRSGWLQAPVRVLEAVGLVSFGPTQQFIESELEILNAVALGACALGLLADLGLFLWLAITPNRPLEDTTAVFD
jgi:uncharacterized membrane protein YhaH (DUF805 family)